MPDIFLRDSSKYTLRLYAKLADIEQDEKETPGKFLDNYGRLSASLPGGEDPKSAEEE